MPKIKQVNNKACNKEKFMRIKLKKVTVASLVQTLVFLSFIPRSTTMQKQLHKTKTGIA
jgi:hypothetical protein